MEPNVALPIHRRQYLRFTFSQLHTVTYRGFHSRWKFISVPKTPHTTVKYTQPISKHTAGVYTKRCSTQDYFYRTSSGNLPTRTHILAVSKSPITGTRPASTFFGHKLSFLQSGSLQTHVLLSQFSKSSNQQESVAKHTRTSTLVNFQTRTDYKSIEVRRQQYRDHRYVSVSIVACVTMQRIGPPFELLRC
jgi:hypothetical protein